MFLELSFCKLKPISFSQSNLSEKYVVPNDALYTTFVISKMCNQGVPLKCISYFWTNIYNTYQGEDGLGEGEDESVGHY